MSTNPPSLTLPKFARNKGISAPPAMTTPANKRTPAVPVLIGPPTGTIPIEPRTPLVVPKIGAIKNTSTPRVGGSNLYEVKSVLQPDENPWLPPKIEGSSDVKIAAITPIGTISMVPTSDKRPATPRRPPATPGRYLTLQVVNQNNPGGTRIDPLLMTAIYLDCTKREDQDYHHVANKMRAITNTVALHKQYITELKPMLPISGRVSQDKFEEALATYENNQVYYQDRIDDKSLDIQTISNRLTELEHWFISIIEPKPKAIQSHDEIDSWKDRELSKLIRGISSYCDPELHKYIQPIGPQHMAFIKQYQIGLV